MRVLGTNPTGDLITVAVGTTISDRPPQSGRTVARSGLLWLNAPSGVAALIIVFPLSILLLLANPDLLRYGDDQQARSMGFVWPRSYVLFLAVLAFIMMLAEGSMLDWGAVFLVDKVGMLEKNAGIGYTAFSIAMTISRFSGNFIIRKIGRRWTITVAALLAAGGFLLAGMLANPVGSVFGFALIGLGATNVVPLSLRRLEGHSAAISRLSQRSATPEFLLALP